MLSQNVKNQTGSILFILVIILGIGTSFWFVGLGQGLLSSKSKNIEYQAWLNLKQIKSQLLQYAVFTPEILNTENETPPPRLTKYNHLAGPGYFPCPDKNADTKVDSSCGNNDIHIDSIKGYLPVAIKGRHFYFGITKQQSKRYYLVLDERFVFRNSSLTYPGTIQPERYAPLNTELNPKPILRLNDDAKFYVALIIDAGLDQRLDTINKEAITNFYTQRSDINKDKIIGISFEEWKILITTRICVEFARFKSVSVLNKVLFWFNGYDSKNNPSGGNWDSLLESKCN